LHGEGHAVSKEEGGCHAGTSLITFLS